MTLRERERERGRDRQTGKPRHKYINCKTISEREKRRADVGLE